MRRSLYTETGAVGPEHNYRLCPLCGCFYTGRCDCAEPRRAAPPEVVPVDSALAAEVLAWFWRDSAARRRLSRRERV